MSKCQHQWFEVTKGYHKTECPSCPHTGDGFTLHLGRKAGVLVQCANCMETKELYGEEQA